MFSFTSNTPRERPQMAEHAEWKVTRVWYCVVAEKEFERVETLTDDGLRAMRIASDGVKQGASVRVTEHQTAERERDVAIVTPPPGVGEGPTLHYHIDHISRTQKD